ncbi:hypothetical protein EF847_00120 [Actinobacteria bacterium YIM 96077]|uniref:Uncharacterized protein n=1 Tax=Phytoactinopolyspora halophila TaxID=1981511 RepID=A0A329QQP7_9ACTN|nr:hypothetical protein [Phytoactinopolyspora halophila]AYY11361.1 hypothetical protein EF847_00120 [Actinobacteria bacterium YIM 96077]RAW14690.1 hypothetical protein DPM12_10550 [Phytoactinopolyspora halophila]
MNTIPTNTHPPASLHWNQNVDTSPAAHYAGHVGRVVVNIGDASLFLSPGAALELARSLQAAVDAFEGHWTPNGGDPR